MTRREFHADLPVTPKFIFKDSLASTKDATFGQKFQSPQTFSKKCFVHCVLRPTMTRDPHRIATHIKNDARIRPKFRPREKISFYCVGQPIVSPFLLSHRSALYLVSEVVASVMPN